VSTDVPIRDAGALRVLVVTDGSAWLAHGLEVHYAAQGSSVAEAIERFESGLREAIALRVQHQKELIRGAGGRLPGDPTPWQWTWIAHEVSPLNVWKEFFKRLAHKELCCQVRPLAVDGLPFDSVWYFSSTARL
jgi:hypothetical protein